MENLNNTNTDSKKIKIDFKDSKYATGRRKRSIAKVWVKKGSGNIYVSTTGTCSKWCGHKNTVGQCCTDNNWCKE